MAACWSCLTISQHSKTRVWNGSAFVFAGPRRTAHFRLKGSAPLFASPKASARPSDRGIGDSGPNRWWNCARSGPTCWPSVRFSAIMDLTDFHPENIEGGRTTAAIAASRFGNVLKGSEDGLILFFQNGKCIFRICRVPGAPHRTQTVKRNLFNAISSAAVRSECPGNLFGVNPCNHSGSFGVGPTASVQSRMS